MPGPRAKTPAERRATGNPGHKAKSKLVDLTPDVVAATIPAGPLGAPPDFLNAAQRAVWLKIAPPLVTLHLLQAADSVAFGRYCGWLLRYIDLERAQRRRSIIDKTSRKSGKMDRHDKGFTALLMIDKRLQEYEDRFAMNPRERQALMARLADGAGRSPHNPPPPSQASEEPERPVASPIGGLRGTSRLQ